MLTLDRCLRLTDVYTWQVFSLNRCWHHLIDADTWLMLLVLITSGGGLSVKLEQKGCRCFGLWWVPGLDEGRGVASLHSLDPTGLISIDLTPYLSEGGPESAGLAKIETKDLNHQHFICGGPNGQRDMRLSGLIRPSVSLFPCLVPGPDSRPTDPLFGF